MQSLESFQQFYYLFKCAGLKLIVCWDLKEHHIMIVIIKNHEGKISVEFPASADLEKSYVTYFSTVTGKTRVSCQKFFMVLVLILTT